MSAHPERGIPPLWLSLTPIQTQRGFLVMFCYVSKINSINPYFIMIYVNILNKKYAHTNAHIIMYTSRLDTV